MTGRRWYQTALDAAGAIASGLLRKPLVVEAILRPFDQLAARRFARRRLKRHACGRAIPGGAVDASFDDAPSGSAVEHFLGDIVDVDLHPACPGRGWIPSHLPDPDIDEAALGTFPSYLVAEEFGARRDPYGEVEGKRFADVGAFGTEGPTVLGLEAVCHANDRLFDHDPHAVFTLVSAHHTAIIAGKAGRSANGGAVPTASSPRGRRRSGGGHAARSFARKQAQADAIRPRLKFKALVRTAPACCLFEAPRIAPPPLSHAPRPCRHRRASYRRRPGMPSSAAPSARPWRVHRHRRDGH